MLGSSKPDTRHYIDGKRSLGDDKLYVLFERYNSSRMSQDYYISLLVNDTIIKFTFDNYSLSIGTKQPMVSLNNIDEKSYKKLVKQYKKKARSIELTTFKGTVNSLGWALLTETQAADYCQTYKIDNFGVTFLSYIKEHGFINNALQEMLIKKEKRELAQSLDKIDKSAEVSLNNNLDSGLANALVATKKNKI